MSEYGVFRGTKRIAGETEESVYRAIGLPLIPAELREDRGEIEAALACRLPQLVEYADLRGDLHTHTTATDGTVAIRSRKWSPLREHWASNTWPSRSIRAVKRWPTV